MWSLPHPPGRARRGRRSRGPGAARRRARPRLEALEDRTLLSADWADANNTFATAYNFGAVQGEQAWAQLSLDPGLDTNPYNYHQDWFRFTTVGAATAANSVTLIYNNSATAPLGIGLYDSQGNLLTYNRTTQDVETLGLVNPQGNLLPAGTYYVQVYALGAGNNYTLEISAPGQLAGDWADPTTSQAPLDFGLVQGSWSWGNLSLDPAHDTNAQANQLQDWFRFTTSQPATAANFAAVTFPGANGPLNLALYDAQGNLLSYKPGGTGFTALPLADGQGNPLPAGTYTLAVYSGGAAGPYTLELNAPGSKADWAEGTTRNNTFATAYNLGPVQGHWNWPPLSLDNQYDPDWFRFDVARQTTAADFVHVRYNERIGLLGLALYDGQGNLVRWYNQAAANDEQLPLTDANGNGLPAGTYYVQVYDGNGQTVMPDYLLDINAPGDRFEPNDTPATATQFGPVLGQRVEDNLSIDNPNDQDWYHLQTVAAGGASNFVRIDFNHLIGNLDLELYDGAGNRLALATGPTDFQQIGLANLPAGDYYLHVLGHNGQANLHYKLTINAPLAPADQFDPNNTFQTAANLGTFPGARPSYSNLSIGTPGEVDWFKFTTTVTGDPSSDARVNFQPAQGLLEIALYDPQGQLLDYSKGYAGTEKVSLAGRPAGTYYVAVYTYATGTNPNYTLTINVAAIPADRFDPNSDSNHAADLGTITGQPPPWQHLSLGPGDLNPQNNQLNDWFKFTTTTTGLPGNFARIDFPNALGSLAIVMYNSKNQLVGESRVSPGDSQVISLAGLPADTYYLAVFANFVGGTNPDYTLTINAPGLAADRFDPNNDFAHAANLNSAATGTLTGPNVWQHLSVGTAGEQDWFKFTTAAAGLSGDFVHIDFQDVQGLLTLALYDGSQKLLGSAADLGDQQEVSLAGLPAGTYYVEVTGFEGTTNPDYTLTVNAPGAGTTSTLFDPDNTRATAWDLGTLQGPQTQTWQDPTNKVDPGRPFAIRDGNDEHWFKFTTVATGQQGDTAGIRFDFLKGALKLELYDNSGSGTPLAVADGADNAETVSLKDLPPGTYYLHVLGVNHAANPNYGLTLLLPGGDWAGNNNSLGQAKDLGSVQGQKSWNDLSLDPGDFNAQTKQPEDWFKFTTLADAGPGNVIRLLSQTGAGQLALALYDSQGNRLAAANAGGYAEQIDLSRLVKGDGTVYALPKGTYYLRVNGLTSAATSPWYALGISAPEPAGADWAEPNGSAAQAYDFHQVQGLHAWGNDPAHPLSVANPGEVDWFKFTTTAVADNGHFAAIQFNGAAGALSLQLYTAADTSHPLATADLGGNVEFVSLAGLAPGTYYLRVSGATPQATNPGYSLTINAPGSAAGDWAGSNNSAAAAYDLGKVYGTVTAKGLSIRPAGEEDWFKFTTAAVGQAAQFVAIAFDNGQGALRLELYAAGDTSHPLAAADAASNTEMISLNGRPAGVYYVRVVGATPQTTNPNYALIVSAPANPAGDWAERHDGKADNGSPADAYPLRQVQGQKVYNNLSVLKPGEQDWFRFQTAGPATGANFVGITYDTTLGDLDVQLLDGNGNVLRSSPDTADNTKRIPLEDATGKPLAAGTYYIRVSGHNGATNPNYALVVNAPVGAIPADWAEPNSNPNDPNDRSLAYDLGPVGGSRSWPGLSVGQPGEVDWFRFTLTQAAPAGAANDFVGIASDPALGSDHDLELQIYDANGTLLAGGTSAAPGGVQKVSLAGQPQGTYYLKVSAQHAGQTNPNYTIIISAPQTPQPDWAEQHDGKADNGSLADAYDLRRIDGLMVAPNLSLAKPGEQDWFRFATSAAGAPGQYARIDFDPTQGSLTLALYDGGGQQLKNVPTTSGSGWLQLSLAGLAQGAYYASVTGVNGATSPNYVLSINGPQSLRRDWAEVHTDGSGNLLTDNNSRANAYDLRDVQSLGAASGGAGTRWTGFTPGFTTVGSNFYNHSLVNAGFGNLISGMSLNTALNTVNNFFSPSGLGGLSTLIGAGTGGLGNLGLGSSFGSSLGLGSGLGSSLTGTGLSASPFGQTSPLFTSSFNPWLPFASFTPTHPVSQPVNSQQAFAGFNLLLAGLLSSSSSFYGLPQGGGVGSSGGPGGSGGLPASNFLGQQLGLAGLDPFGNAVGGVNSPFGGLGSSPLYGSGSPGGFNSYGSPATTVYDNGFLNVSSDGVIGGDGPFARNAAGLQQAEVFPNLSVTSAGDVGWFKFELGADGVEGQFARITFDHNLGNLYLTLHDGSGAAIDTSANAGQDGQQVSLAGLPRGIYYAEVGGINGATNPNYTLVFSLTPPGEPGNDWVQAAAGNTTQQTAYDLRTVEGPLVLSSLSISPDPGQPNGPGRPEWFAFTTTTAAVAGDFVRINFNNAQGDLDLALVDAAGNVLGQSTGVGNSEQIDLSHLLKPDGTAYALPAGTYYIKVYGYEGATNPQYTLSLNAPSKTIGPDALDPNDSLALATDLSLFSGVSHIPGLTITPGNKDYYQFTVANQDGAAHWAAIAFDPGQGSLTLQLLDAQGNHLADGVSVNGTLQVALDKLSAGTYYLLVSGGDATVANTYDLRFNLPPATNGAPNTWTVMVYMTASNLADAAAANIKQMEQAAANLPGSVHFAVLLDQSTKSPSIATGNGTQPAWGGTGEAIIRPDSDPGKIGTAFDTSLGDLDTGDPNTLVNFIKWAAGQAPAQHYALVLWDHGDGVQGFNFDDQDNAAPDHLTVAKLASALQQSPVHFDVLAFDACLMQMAEVGDSLGAYAQEVVGSEEVEPGSGYDYTKAFTALQGDPATVDARALAAGIVQSYQNQYQADPSGDNTLSATDAARYSAFNAALLAFTTAAVTDTTTADWDLLRRLQSAAVTFTGSPNYRDLGQYLQAVAGGFPPASALAVDAQGVLTALQNLVTARAVEQRHTSGLSIYFPAPGTPLDSSYIAAFQSFFQATGWNAFLQTFVSGQTGTNGVAPDWAESNNTAAQAYNLHRLAGAGNTYSGLSIGRPGEQDWFRFFTQAAGGGNDSVAVNTASTSTPLQVVLYSAAADGSLTQQGQATTDATGRASLSLAGLGAGAYFVEVQGNGQAVVPQYTLTVNAPGAAAASDWVRGNDTSTKAHDLGVISNPVVFSGLALAPAQPGQAPPPNWFTFHAPKTLTAAQGSITFTPAGSQSVTVQVEDAQGNLLASQTGAGRLKLAYPLREGATYLLEVSGGAGGYSLGFAPVTPSAGPPSWLAALARLLTHSAEYYGGVVAAAYQRYLGRAPGAGEAAGWVAALQSGAVTDERLEAGFIGSPEYVQAHGGAGAGWVKGMYQDLLGRTPSQAEVDAWVSALQAGRVTPTQVALQFAAGAEREGQHVTADYLQFLGRSPSAAEVQGWVSAFTSGAATNEDVIAGFAGSPEYYQKQFGDVPDWFAAVYPALFGSPAGQAGAAPSYLPALARLLTHSAEYYGGVVAAAYQRYLGRAPGAGEAAGWVAALQSGAVTDERLEASFIGSPEYVQAHGGAGAGWVKGMYQDLLGRTPSQAEVDAWVQALQAGTPPSQVAYGFAAGAERESQRVTADYQTFLGRAPSAAEVQGWVDAFTAGRATNEDVIAGFVGSPEYFLKHGGDPGDWLDQALLGLFK